MYTGAAAFATPPSFGHAWLCYLMACTLQLQAVEGVKHASARACKPMSVSWELEALGVDASSKQQQLGWSSWSRVCRCKSSCAALQRC